MPLRFTPHAHQEQAFAAEVDVIFEWARQAELERSCLVARTNALRERYEDALKARGLATYRIKRSEAEDLRAPGLRVATMHRVKGLEFDRMILAGMSDYSGPWDEQAECARGPAGSGRLPARLLLVVDAGHGPAEELDESAISRPRQNRPGRSSRRRRDASSVEWLSWQARRFYCRRSWL